MSGSTGFLRSRRAGFSHYGILFRWAAEHNSDYCREYGEGDFIRKGASRNSTQSNNRKRENFLLRLMLLMYEALFKYLIFNYLYSVSNYSFLFFKVCDKNPEQ